MKKKLILFLFISGIAYGQSNTFTNPLLPSGADPWSIYHNGWYYYTHTTGKNVTLWKTRSLAELDKATSKIVWSPPEGTPYSKDVWAPELHYLEENGVGQWYIYVAADDGHNRNHRMWVLENPSEDPLEGQFTLKGQLKTPGGDKWAIDGSVFEHQGQRYFVWSGWEGDENGQQNLYICRLKNPWITEGQRVLISEPAYAWERHGTIPHPGPDDKPQVYVNEGPQPLRHGNKIFIIYSASGCWTDHYALGMLWADAQADLMDSKAWQKHPEPVFKAKNTKGTHGAGHHSFFKSPDGKEDWILYHANPEPGQGCGGYRSPRMQKFTWNAKGMPDFGVPLPLDTTLVRPSGE